MVKQTKSTRHRFRIGSYEYQPKEKENTIYQTLNVRS